MAAYRRVYDSRHVTCRLAAKNRDQRIRVDLDIAVSAQPLPNAAYHSGRRDKHNSPRSVRLS